MFTKLQAFFMRNMSCEIISYFFKKEDPAKIRTCMYFITDKKFSTYFKNTYDCYKAIKSSLTLAKSISANKI